VVLTQYPFQWGTEWVCKHILNRKKETAMRTACQVQPCILLARLLTFLAALATTGLTSRSWATAWGDMFQKRKKKEREEKERKREKQGGTPSSQLWRGWEGEGGSEEKETGERFK